MSTGAMKRYIKEFFLFIEIIARQRYMIMQLARRDFKNKYLASYVGLPWAFIQPAVTILVMWFVFAVGFKTSNLNTGEPFTAWLIIGMAAWNFINETLSSSTGSLIEYSYLIKKVYFRPSIIPLIKILTALIIHSFFILVAAIVAFVYGYYPSLYWIQLPYYLIAAVVLIVGIGWVTSSLTVFVRDVEKFISVGMQILFWATPVFWHQSRLEGNLKFIAYLNPFFYIVNGYRESLFNQSWFFEHQFLTVYFWGITGFFFIFGAMLFRSLKPHFADVL